MKNLPKYLLYLSLMLVASCCPLMSPTLISAVNDHRDLCTETNNAIINTLHDECASITDADKISACVDLINRLETISKQAEVIDKYINSQMSEEDMVSYLRYRWRNP